MKPTLEFGFGHPGVVLGKLTDLVLAFAFLTFATIFAFLAFATIFAFLAFARTLAPLLSELRKSGLMVFDAM